MKSQPWVPSHYLSNWDEGLGICDRQAHKEQGTMVDNKSRCLLLLEFQAAVIFGRNSFSSPLSPESSLAFMNAHQPMPFRILLPAIKGDLPLHVL